MPKLSSIFNFKNRQIAAIWLFVLLVLIAETLASFLPQNKLVQSLQASKVLPEAPDIQIMGDSVARDGLVAARLQEFVPGRSVNNFAIAGTGPELPYFILKRQIAAGKAPRAIIYAPSPHTFASKRVALLVGGFCDWDEVGEVASARKEPFEVLYGVLCKISYTLRHREQIADILKGNAPLFARTSTPKESKEDLATVAAKRKYPREKLHPMYRARFEVHRFNLHYYEKFLTLAQANKIPVYWVNMPILSAVGDSRKEVDFETHFAQFLEDTQKRFGVRVLQEEFLVYEDAVFRDYTHLDSVGAERFTQVIGEKLRPMLAGQSNSVARW